MNIIDKLKYICNCLNFNHQKTEVYKFRDLEIELINKIKNTPYWTEYPTKSQETMISKYFDKKIRSQKYTGITYNTVDKSTFIEEVLKSVV